MFINALIVVFSYWLVKLLDNITGYQSICRPIVVGAVTGLFLGDVKTGVIMGCELEAIYMGVSSIGGVIASDTITATIISTAFVILSGIDLEAGMALAVVIGTLMNSFNTIDKFCKNLFYRFKASAVEAGNDGRFKFICTIQALFFEHEFACILMFLAIYFGTDAVTAWIVLLPSWFVNGLSCAANMMTAVGLSMIAVGIMGPGMGVFVILGFIMYKYFNLSAIVIATIGIVIAILMFQNEIRMKKLEDAKLVTTAAFDNDNEGDDIYD